MRLLFSREAGDIFTFIGAFNIFMRCSREWRMVDGWTDYSNIYECNTRIRCVCVGEKLFIYFQLINRNNISNCSISFIYQNYMYYSNNQKYIIMNIL